MTFWANLRRYSVTDRVTLWLGTADRQLPGRSDRFDLIFIDGAHDRDSVESDIRHAWPLLADDGLMVFHDYGGPHYHVTAAVDALVGSGGEFLSLVGSLAVVKPPVPVPSLQLQEA